MVIRWHPRALGMVRIIHDFYSEKSKRTAEQIVQRIFHAVDKLESFPWMAPVEALLTGRAEEYRSLIVRKMFKVIYFIHESSAEVVIVAVVDCRRNPEKLKHSMDES